MSQETLRIVDSNFAKQLLDLFSFHEFCDRLLPGYFRSIANTSDRCLIDAVVTKITDKLAINFEVIDLEPFEVAKRRNPASEVVQCKANLMAAHRFEELPSPPEYWLLPSSQSLRSTTSRYRQRTRATAAQHPGGNPDLRLSGQTD